MVGVLTPNFKLNVPDFDQIPWDDDVNENWSTIDSVMSTLTAIPNFLGVWRNSTFYQVGAVLVDSAYGTQWKCLVQHTSMDPPYTFENERQSFAGYWSLFAQPVQAFLPLTGGTLSGPIEIKTTAPNMGVNGSYIILSSNTGTDNIIAGQTNEIPRWLMAIGDGAAESGSNAGSNFTLNRYADDGSFLGGSIAIDRSTGIVSIFEGSLTTGLVTINMNSPAALFTPTGIAAFHIQGKEGSGVSALLDSVGTTGAFYTTRASRGTVGAPTAVQTTDILGAFRVFGYGATQFSAGPRGGMTAYAAENWTDTAHGTHVSFSTTPIGSTTLTERVRVAASGNLLVNTSVDGIYGLDVSARTRVDPFAQALGPLPSTLGLQAFTIAANDGTPPQQALVGFGNSSTPSIQMWRANGARAAPTALLGATAMGAIQGYGYGATGYSTARAIITFVASENWTDTAQGSSIFFSATPLGSVTTSALMRLWGSGNLMVGGTLVDSGYKLDITGNTRLNGTVGFQGTNPIAKPTVSGAKGSNAALGSLITALVNYGLILDTTTA